MGGVWVDKVPQPIKRKDKMKKSVVRRERVGWDVAMWVNKVTLLTKWEEKMRKNCCDLGHALTMDQKDLGSSVVFLLVIWLFS